VEVHAEAGEEGDGLRISPASFAQPRGSVGGVKLRHTPAVVRDDRERIDFAHDEHTRRADRHGFPGVTPEPQRLLRRPTLEPVEDVVVPQRFGSGIRLSQSAKGEGRDMRSRNPGSHRRMRDNQVRFGETAIRFVPVRAYSTEVSIPASFVLCPGTLSSDLTEV
jgi:hypothetical protein